jgi:hypothetical protein
MRSVDNAMRAHGDRNTLGAAAWRASDRVSLRVRADVLPAALFDCVEDELW